VALLPARKRSDPVVIDVAARRGQSCLKFAVDRPLPVARVVVLSSKCFREKSMRKVILPLAALALILQPGLALAYIGPGVGAGAIGAVIGVIGSIFLAIFAVIWYPVKRLLKGRKKAGPAKAKTPSQPE
jgi:hypothetical protein